MDVLISLLSQMSIESIILAVVALITAAKLMSDLFDWLYGKLKDYFNIKDKTKEEQKEIREQLDRIEKKCDERGQEVQEIKKEMSAVRSRLQDSTRSYILDKYHYYVQELGIIDEAALQDLERRYLYYKNDGGDSFIELRMEELRNLPMMTPEQLIELQKSNSHSMRHFVGRDDDE